MKKKLWAGLVVGLALLVTAAASQATSISAGDYVKVSAYNPLDGAGIMTYAVSKDKGATTAFFYDTFCIQDNVFVWLNTWYPVAGLSTTVGKFDSPPAAGSGTLNGAVDYLFYLYKKGNYSSTMTSDAAEDDFQRLLWKLQGTETVPFTTPGSYQWETDLAAYQTDGSLHKSWGTQVINIATSLDTNGVYHGPDIQNQLYNDVPEPASMLIMGGALAGLIGVARKKKNI